MLGDIREPEPVRFAASEVTVHEIARGRRVRDLAIRLSIGDFGEAVMQPLRDPAGDQTKVLHVRQPSVGRRIWARRRLRGSLRRIASVGGRRPRRSLPISSGTAELGFSVARWHLRAGGRPERYAAFGPGLAPRRVTLAVATALLILAAIGWSDRATGQLDFGHGDGIERCRASRLRWSERLSMCCRANA